MILMLEHARSIWPPSLLISLAGCLTINLPPGDGGAKTTPPGATSVVARDAPGLYGIAVEGNTVYATNRVTMRVVTAPSDAVDVPAQAIVAESQEVRDIAVESRSLFLGLAQPLNEPCIVGYARDGSERTTIQDNCAIRRMVRTPSSVFALVQTSSLTINVIRVDAVTRVASEVVNLFTAPAGVALAVASDGGWVYFVRGDEIQRAEAGGTPVVFAPKQTVKEMVADGSALYWVTPAGSVKKVGTGEPGGTVEEIASGLVSPQQVAHDETFLYVTCFGAGETDGRVVRIPKAGGASVDLAVNQPKPQGITVNASAVFWTNEGDGTIARVPK